MNTIELIFYLMVTLIVAMIFVSVVLMFIIGRLDAKVQMYECMLEGEPDESDEVEDFK